MINKIIAEYGKSFNDLEKEIYLCACKMGCKFLSEVLEGLDAKLSRERDKGKYRHKGKKKTSIKTIMGEVEFSRAIYKSIDDKGSTSFTYLLDEYLDLKTIGLMSASLTEKIVENASKLSFRNAAKNITKLTGQTISHGGVWNVIQSLGARLQEKETEQVNIFNQRGSTGQKEVPVLFEEADGVYIKTQGKSRIKRQKGIEMKVAVSYEGWKETAKDRFELVNKLAYVGIENASIFRRQKEAIIGFNYNTDEITMRILNGDGASWIKHEIDENVHYQLDPFHKYQAVVRSVKDRKHRSEIKKLLQKNKIEETLLYIKKLALITEEIKESEKIMNLYNYFQENKEGLLPYNERGLNIPKSPEGLIYRNLGTMEHNICDIIAQRMKHRKASWSIGGAQNLGKILAAQASKRLSNVIAEFSDTVLQIDNSIFEHQVLSAGKAPKKDGKGCDGTVSKGSVPLLNAALTNGRKAILKIFAGKFYGGFC